MKTKMEAKMETTRKMKKMKKLNYEEDEEDEMRWMV